MDEKVRGGEGDPAETKEESSVQLAVYLESLVSQPQRRNPQRSKELQPDNALLDHKWNFNSNTCPYCQSILIYKTTNKMYVVTFLKAHFRKEL